MQCTGKDEVGMSPERSQVEDGPALVRTRMAVQSLRNVLVHVGFGQSEWKSANL